VFVPQQVGPFVTQERLGIPDAVFTGVHRFLQFFVPTVDAIDPSTGALNPALASFTPEQFAAALEPIGTLLAVPTPAAVAARPDAAPGLKLVPLVVFQHGLSGSRFQMVAIANELASRGFAVAAIDLPLHGERSFCDSNDDCTTDGTNAGTCTPDPARAGQGDTVVPGTCTGGSRPKLVGGLTHQGSGNYFVSLNFFRTRDSIRQHLIDHSALLLAVARPPAGVPQPPEPTGLQAALATAYVTDPQAPPNPAGIVIDPTEIYFAGISLGAIEGTSVVATNPRYERAVLNVGGGTIVDVFTSAPRFQERIAELFAGLGVNVPCATTGTGCASPADQAAQAARFAQTLSIAKWVLDPADPINWAANVETKLFSPDLAPLVSGGLGSTTTEAFGQLVSGDTVVPNPTNRLLFELIGLDDDAAPPEYVTYLSGTIPEDDRHGLLLFTDFNPATNPVNEQAGDIIREDLADFLESLTRPVTRNVQLP
jgi:pimeloyl-ACP methyl ester carboxylesterase